MAIPNIQQSVIQEQKIIFATLMILIQRKNHLKMLKQRPIQSFAAHIAACLSEYEKAVKNGADPETLSRLNWAFHTAMCEPANRPRMMAIVVSLYTATDRYLRLQINRPGAKAKALKDHRVIFEAYQDKRAAEVGKLIKAHIMGAYDDVMSRLKDSLDSELPASARR